MKSKKPFVAMMVVGIVLLVTFLIVMAVGGIAGSGVKMAVADDPGDADAAAVLKAFNIVLYVGIGGAVVGAALMIVGIVMQVVVGKKNAQLEQK